MHSRSFALLAGFASLAAVLALLGCQGPQGPPGMTVEPPAYVSGFVTFWSGDTNGAYASVSLQNASNIAAITVNGLPIPVDLYGGGFPNYNADNLALAPGDSAHLLINFTQLDGQPGSARADLKTPGAFEILTPDSILDSLEFADTLNLAWSSSEGAEAYWVLFVLSFSYFDTIGFSHFEYESNQFLSYDTAFTVLPSSFVPDSVVMDSVYGFWGYIQLQALSDWFDIGEAGNVSGDALGYLRSNYYLDQIYFGQGGGRSSGRSPE